MNVMSVIKTIYKTPWGLGRWLRLGIGLAFMVDAYLKGSNLVAFMGLFLAYQALFNTGCGLGIGQNECGTSAVKKNPHDISHNFKQLNRNQ